MNQRDTVPVTKSDELAKAFVAASIAMDALNQTLGEFYRKESSARKQPHFQRRGEKDWK